jgi:hypothetical protein
MASQGAAQTSFVRTPARLLRLARLLLAVGGCSATPAAVSSPGITLPHASSVLLSPQSKPSPASQTGGQKQSPQETLHDDRGREERAAADMKVPTAEAAPAVASYFEGRTEVTYSEFIDEFRKIADSLSSHPEVKAAHQALLLQKQLTEEELPLESFSRVRLAFESARDSGLWGIRGVVTDQMPWSDRIWQQWAERDFTPEAPVAGVAQPAFPSAEAECDELGALFSILARDLGVIGFVGLHWPYWNHVVPIWQVNRKDGTFVRIIVPATQTFLDNEETIGTTGLPAKRVIFPYVRKDRKSKTLISADLARFLLTQSQTYGGLSTAGMTHKRLLHRWTYRPGAEAQAPPVRDVMSAPLQR